MDLCNESRLSGQTACWGGGGGWGGWPTCIAKILTQTVQPICSKPAMLIGTNDFYHFIPFSLTLTLPGVTKSVQSTALWLHFLTHFSYDQDEIWSDDDAVQAEHPETWARFMETREINCCFTDYIKKNSWHPHAFRCLWVSLIYTWYDDRYYCTVHFSTSLIDLDSKSQECKKANISLPIISQSFWLIWMEFGTL